MKLFNPHAKVVAGPAPDGNVKVMVTPDGKKITLKPENKLLGKQTLFHPGLRDAELAAWQEAVRQAATVDPFS